MKLITKDTDYGIIALKFLAENREKTYSVSDMAKVLDVPKPFLRKILQKLARAGILRSHKGKGGGFSLGIEAKDISVLDVMAAFQGNFELSQCVLNKKVCPRIPECVLRKKIIYIQQLLQDELKGINIGQLVKEEE